MGRSAAAVPDPSPSDLAAIGSRCRALRERQGLSTRDLAAISGVGHATISRFERGLFSPNLQSVWRLAHGLGIQPCELIDCDGTLVAIAATVADVRRQVVDLAQQGHGWVCPHCSSERVRAGSTAPDVGP